MWCKQVFGWLVNKIRKGMASMKQVIGLSVGLLLAAILFPIAINQIASTSTSSWNPAVATVFTVLLPVLAVIALIFYFTPKGK